jgi:hypothetical protein
MSNSRNDVVLEHGNIARIVCRVSEVAYVRVGQGIAIITSSIGTDASILTIAIATLTKPSLMRCNVSCNVGFRSCCPLGVVGIVGRVIPPCGKSRVQMLVASRLFHPKQTTMSTNQRGLCTMFNANHAQAVTYRAAPKPPTLAYSARHSRQQIKSWKRAPACDGPFLDAAHASVGFKEPGIAWPYDSARSKLCIHYVRLPCIERCAEKKSRYMRVRAFGM